MLVYNMQGLQKKFRSKIQKKSSLFAEGHCWPSAKKLFAESLTGWLSAKVTAMGAVHGAAPLPRAFLCRELGFRQSWPLPSARLCRELSCRQRVFAYGPP